MYYIEQENEELVKYEVELDKESLENLKIEIIENCAEIEHICRKGTINPESPFDVLHIRNYKETIIGMREGREYEPDEDIYQFEYDKYKDTKLINIIDNLIDGNTNTILELKNPKLEQKEDMEQQIRKEIDRLHSQISTADNLSIIAIADKLKALADKLKKVQEDKARNLDRKSDLEYYPKVLKCITLKEVTRIKIETIEELNNLYNQTAAFFSSTISKNINPKVDKNLYKRLIIK